MSKSARFSVLYTKYMKQTYKGGMYKILKEKKETKSLILIHIGLKGYRTENDIKNSKNILF